MALQNVSIGKPAPIQVGSLQPSNGKFSTSRTRIDVVELLLSTGMVDRPTLDEAVSHSRVTGIPVCQVLVMLNQLSGRLCQPVMGAAELVNKNQIQPEEAIAALRKVWEGRPSLAAALQELKDNQVNFGTIKIAALLFEAGVVTDEQLEQAFSVSRKESTPIGQALVQLGFLSSSQLFAALSTQELIREGTITREQGVQTLRAMHLRRVSIDRVLREQSFGTTRTSPSVMLGELLVLSHIISEQDVMLALETSQQKELPLGQELLNRGFVTEKLLDAALRVQEMVQCATLTLAETTEVLSLVHGSEVSMEQALSVLDLPAGTNQASASYLELICAANYAALEALTPFENLVEDVRETGMKLYQHDLITANQLFNSLRCYSLMYRGTLKADDAAFVLQFCKAEQVSVDSALKKLRIIVK